MTLYDTVDHFVLVEANKTHTGKPKEFIFAQNKHLFTPYLNKIIYIKVEDLPDYTLGTMWVPENFQRLCIERGLESMAVEGDKIVISDIDEIPNPTTVLANLNTNNPVALQQHLFYYYVNCKQNQLWSAPVILTRGHYESVQTSRIGAFNCSNSVPNGGWHYSYMGGAEKIRLKVENIAESHVIINSVGGIEDIEKKMLSQTDLWNRTEPLAQKSIVNIFENDLAPKCIMKFIAKYPNFYFNKET